MLTGRGGVPHLLARSRERLLLVREFPGLGPLERGYGSHEENFHVVPLAVIGKSPGAGTAVS